MKTLIVALGAVCLASPALAISRYNFLDKSCEAVQQIIKAEKSVLLRYPSRDGKVMLYDRYVSNDGQCGTNFFYAANASVPTKDNPSCPVRNCKLSSTLEPR